MAVAIKFENKAFCNTCSTPISNEHLIGEILIWPGTTAPENWAICDGSIYDISNRPELYAVLKITFGGDGLTTFGLPDLRSRVPKGVGVGPGIGTTTLGDKQSSAAPGTSDVHTLGLNYIIKIQ